MNRITDRPIRAISYGGGIQSTAMVVLAATGQLKVAPAPGADPEPWYPHVAVISNVGDDSELPETMPYVRRHVIPWAQVRGFEVTETWRKNRKGERSRTLLEELERDDSRSVGIPVRMSNGAPGTRNCTPTYKLKPVDRWLRDHGATPAMPAEVAIGFSTDELARSTTKRDSKVSVPVYPLLDLRLDRSACREIIVESGLPVPPKSACWFCPMRTYDGWRLLRRDRPELFDKSVRLEATLNARRAKLGKDEIYFTQHKDRGVKLATVPPADPALFDVTETDFGGGCGTDACGT